MGWETEAIPILIAGNTTIVNSNGLFMYNGKSAANNLILAETPHDFTDPYGNKVFAGLNILTPFSVGRYELLNISQLSGAYILYYSATGQNSWTQGAFMNYPSVNQLQINADAIIQTAITGGLAQNFQTSEINLNFLSSVPTLFGNLLNMWADANGYFRFNSATAGDNNTYTSGQANRYNTGSQLINSATPVVIGSGANQFSWNVLAGVTYWVRFWLIYSGAAAAGAPSVGFNGTATANQVNGFNSWYGPGNVFSIGGFVLGSFALMTGPTLNTGNNSFVMEAAFNCSVSGVLNIRAQTDGTNNWTIKGAHAQFRTN
jgi:hypothetical protein